MRSRDLSPSIAPELIAIGSDIKVDKVFASVALTDQAAWSNRLPLGVGVRAVVDLSDPQMVEADVEPLEVAVVVPVEGSRLSRLWTPKTVLADGRVTDYVANGAPYARDEKGLLVRVDDNREGWAVATCNQTRDGYGFRDGAGHDIFLPGRKGIAITSDNRKGDALAAATAPWRPEGYVDDRLLVTAEADRQRVEQVADRLSGLIMGAWNDTPKTDRLYAVPKVDNPKQWDVYEVN